MNTKRWITFTFAILLLILGDIFVVNSVHLLYSETDAMLLQGIIFFIFGMILLISYIKQKE